MNASLTSDEVEELNLMASHMQSSDIVKWVASRFGDDVVATSSFQTQSVPLLHLLSVHAPEIPVVFLNTGFHFKETLDFVEELRGKLHLNLIIMESLLGIEGFARKYGQLHQEDQNMCCYLNKVEPMARAIEGRQAWMTGVRSDQTETRSEFETVNLQKNGMVKVCPMLKWTSEDVADYIREHELPSHPLYTKGYLSVGCSPCTKKADCSLDARSGRWEGTDKTECGLHTDL